MTDQKIPTNIMGVSLLHKCNFNCEHCGYIYIGDTEDHIIRPGYKLTWDQERQLFALDGESLAGLLTRLSRQFLANA